jgi:hypothetical protein
MPHKIRKMASNMNINNINIEEINDLTNDLS